MAQANKRIKYTKDEVLKLHHGVIVLVNAALDRAVKIGEILSRQENKAASFGHSFGAKAPPTDRMASTYRRIYENRPYVPDETNEVTEQALHLLEVLTIELNRVFRLNTEQVVSDGQAIHTEMCLLTESCAQLIDNAKAKAKDIDIILNEQ